MTGTNGERKRLQEVYASKADGELEQLAEDAGSLTDLAQECLRAEISRRGLPIELRFREDAEHPKLVMVGRYRDPAAASLAGSQAAVTRRPSAVTGR